MIMTNTSGDVN